MVKKALVSMADLEKAMAVSAEQEAAAEKSAMTNNISTKGKKFKLGDEVLGDTLTCVVLGTVFENSFYDGVYDPDNPLPPACFAIGEDEDDLYPDETGPDIQAESCQECPHNEWGSADIGEGKKCKNGRRLAVYAYGEDGLYVDQIAILKLSPTSLKHWSGYAKSVANRLKRPTWGVVTEFNFDANSDWPVVIPTMVEKIGTVEEIEAIKEGIELAQQLLNEPYDVSGYVDPADRKKARTSKKKTTKKKFASKKKARSKVS